MAPKKKDGKPRFGDKVRGMFRSDRRTPSPAPASFDDTPSSHNLSSPSSTMHLPSISVDPAMLRPIAGPSPNRSPAHFLQSLSSTMHPASADISQPALIEPRENDGGTGTNTEVDDSQDPGGSAPLSNKIRSTLDAIVLLARRAKPLVEGTVAAVPFSAVLVIADVYEAIEKMKGTATETHSRLISRLEVLRGALEKTENAESRRRIVEFVQDLDSVGIRLKAALGTATWRKVLQTPELQTLLEDLDSQMCDKTELFQLDILLANERDTTAVLESLTNIRLKEWLLAPAATYNIDNKRYDAPPRNACSPGTRKAVLAQIQAWAEDASAPPIFWLSGMAGTGKSTIAYSTCGDFDINDSRDPAIVGAFLGASFFCSRQAPDLRNTGNIIPTISYQLARRCSSFAASLRSCDDDVVRQTANMQIRELLINPWKRSVRSRDARLPSALVVIDALDELDSDDGEAFLSCLVTAAMDATQDALAGLKILITSRPHPKIAKLVSDLSRKTILRLEDINKQDTDADIRTFLDKEFRTVKTLSLSDHELTQLVHRADGLFIYAVTLCRHIMPPRAIEMLTAVDVREALEQLINVENGIAGGEGLALDALYRQVVGNMLEQSSRARRENEARRILHAILIAAQPISLDELTALVPSVNAAFALKVIDSLYAVIYVSNGHIHTYHKSFPDFMLNKTRSNSTFCCANSPLHLAFYQSCMSIMTKSLRFNICDLPSSYLFDSEVEALLDSVKTNIRGVVGLEYACRFWSHHLSQTRSGEESCPAHTVDIARLGADAKVLEDVYGTMRMFLKVNLKNSRAGVRSVS
ncbi:hypothetical protein BDV98DRAFT_608404 [Pterulicium gracile]|uniref:Nephrocystin 3-like N-terminal domain-containing protein n=1 Tax=Pterulicium gracile TaxID=1884261 RepID=A0A5C3Q2H4_9AGAR|nr:hypothetical protein BDV98DRAFT_608404 [Pterula gracilis]